VKLKSFLKQKLIFQIDKKFLCKRAINYFKLLKLFNCVINAKVVNFVCEYFYNCLKKFAQHFLIFEVILKFKFLKIFKDCAKCRKLS
jgi:hypothetical protein